MKSSITLEVLVCLISVFSINAQKDRKPNLVRKQTQPVSTTKPGSVIPKTAFVIDERLAILRTSPSLYADSVQRMRTGKIVAISGVKEVEGVTFYRVTVPPKNYGWVQTDALAAKNRPGDDERLARLIQASEGFEKIERAVLYLENFPNSPLRPSILLLLGDLAEELTLKLSRDASRQLDKREMAASGAPLHSFFLNHVSLDRYRKLGINFWFNSATRNYHYNGVTWREILTKYPKSNESIEAQKRLDSLKEKMESKGEKK